MFASESAQTLGAPGLDFETWETSALNRFLWIKLFFQPFAQN